MVNSEIIEEPPLTLYTCEACDGAGGYEVDEMEYDAQGAWRRLVEVSRCPCCDGFGHIVVEAEDDEAAGIETLSLRSTQSEAERIADWNRCRAKMRAMGIKLDQGCKS